MRQQFAELRPGGRYRNGQAERRYLYGLLRRAGFTVCVATRLRDWQIDSVFGQLAIHIGDGPAHDALAVIPRRTLPILEEKK